MVRFEQNGGDVTFVTHPKHNEETPRPIVRRGISSLFVIPRAEAVALAAEMLRHFSDPEWQPDNVWLVIEDDRKVAMANLRDAGPVV